MFDWLKKIGKTMQGKGRLLSKRGGRRKRHVLVGVPSKKYAPEEKLKLLQEFENSGLSVTTFCGWHGMRPETLKKWKERYKAEGEAGLADRQSGNFPAQLPDAVKEKIVELKQNDPKLGSKRIRQELLRHNFVKVAATTILKILGADERTKPLVEHSASARGQARKAPEPQRFERAKPRQLFQMDTFTWFLRGLYRVYLIGCLDDHSRFMAAWKLARRASSSNAVDVVRDAAERYGLPDEVLTDNGRQYYTWRGKCDFQKFLQKSGIRHIRSRPYHPQTLGKIESFWRNLHQELLSRATLSSFEEAETKIKEWIERYNFKRPHQGIEGMTPADRFFGVEKPMREAMLEGVAMVKNALVLEPKKLGQPMYLVGHIGGKEIRIMATQGSVVVEGLEGMEKKVLTRTENDVQSPGSPALPDILASPETTANSVRPGEPRQGAEANEPSRDHVAQASSLPTEPSRGAEGRQAGAASAPPLPDYAHPSGQEGGQSDERGLSERDSAQEESGNGQGSLERKEESEGGVRETRDKQAGILQVGEEGGSSSREDAGARPTGAETEESRGGREPASGTEQSAIQE